MQSFFSENNIITREKFEGAVVGFHHIVRLRGKGKKVIESNCGEIIGYLSICKAWYKLKLKADKFRDKVE